VALLFILLAPHAKGLHSEAWAQAQNGFNTSYFDKNVGGGTVSIINALQRPVTCALIYVFKNDEQLQECCGCPVTNSGGLRTIRLATIISRTTFASLGSQFPRVNPVPSELSEFDTLTDNPNSGTFLDRGDIKIISSIPNGPTGDPFGICDPTLAPLTAPGTPGVVDELREYSTSFQGFPEITGVTEHEWLGAPDPTTSGEVASLDFLCGGIFHTGSGRGICGCGRGDLVPK